MLIVCPACGTRFHVDDDEVGDEGRKVRCGNCQEVWMQPAPQLEDDPVSGADEEDGDGDSGLDLDEFDLDDERLP